MIEPLIARPFPYHARFLSTAWHEPPSTPHRPDRLFLRTTAAAQNGSRRRFIACPADASPRPVYMIGPATAADVDFPRRCRRHFRWHHHRGPHLPARPEFERDNTPINVPWTPCSMPTRKPGRFRDIFHRLAGIVERCHDGIPLPAQWKLPGAPMQQIESRARRHSPDAMMPPARDTP